MSQIAVLKSRFRAAAIHLGVSALIIGLAAVFVFHYWYPWPYSTIAGGRDLFLLVLSVDLVLGPLLTLVVFNTTKSRSHLMRDLAVIGLVQIIGLGYGLHTAFSARPVAIVFEVDQFRVVSETDVMREELGQALPEFRKLSWSGPTLLAARRPANSEERLKALDYALQGFDVGTRPSFWRPYNELKPAVLERARPLSALYSKYPAHKAEIDQAVAKAGRLVNDVVFLPVMGRESDWSALLDAKTADLIGFVPLEGYF